MKVAFLVASCLSVQVAQAADWRAALGIDETRSFQPTVRVVNTEKELTPNNLSVGLSANRDKLVVSFDIYEESQTIELDLEEVRGILRPFTEPNSYWQILRRSGGYSPGTLIGMEIRYENSKNKESQVHPTFGILDFAREAGTRNTRSATAAPPTLKSDGYGYSSYHKSPKPEEIKRFRWTVPRSLNDQRFVLDFDGFTVVPIFVFGYKGDIALFTSIDFKQDADRMKPGEFLELRTYEVPAKVLRLADTPKYQQAFADYLDQRDNRKIGQIIRANRPPIERLGSQMINVDILEDADGTFRNIHKHLSPADIVGEGIVGDMSMCSRIRNGRSISLDFEP